MLKKSRALATKEEVAKTLSSLTDSDLLRLKRIAQLRASGLTSVDWRDLLNEAVERSLNGTRRWPCEIPFVAFMAQTIRSIANEHWRQVHERVVTAESDLAPSSLENEESNIDNLGNNPIHPEREIVARNTLREIEELFSDDSEIIAILEGLGEGLSPSEIQRNAQINPTKYASAQKRIRRKLARVYSEIS